MFASKALERVRVLGVVTVHYSDDRGRVLAHMLRVALLTEWCESYDKRRRLSVIMM